MRPKRCSRCALVKAAYCFEPSEYLRPLKPRCRECRNAVSRLSRRRRYPSMAEHERARQRWRYRLDAEFRRRHIARATLRKARLRAAAKEEKAWYLRRSA